MPLDANPEPVFLAYERLAAALAKPQGLTALHVTTGVGKSHAIAAAAKATGRPSLISTATRGLGVEAQERIPEARHHPGRTSPEDSEGDPEAWCHVLPAVSEVGERNHAPAASICRQCVHGAVASLQRLEKEFGTTVPERLPFEASARARRALEALGDLDPGSVAPCRFLFEALPQSLAAYRLIASHAAYSEPFAGWGPSEGRQPRDIYVDEPPPLAKELVLSAPELARWLERAEQSREKAEMDWATAEQQLAACRRLEARQAATGRLEKVEGRLAVLQEVPEVLAACIVAINAGRPPDVELRQRLAELAGRARASGAIVGVTALWEQVRFACGEGRVDAPLRALLTLARSLATGSFMVSGRTWRVYEITPLWEELVERARRGAEARGVVADATLSLAARDVVEAAGGAVETIVVPQRIRVSRVVGYGWFRGEPRKSRYSAYATGRLREIEAMARACPANTAFITHKSYLRYAYEYCGLGSDHRGDVSERAKEMFEERTGCRIGWWGKHDVGHNDWEFHNIVIVGMPLLSMESFAEMYSCDRAAVLALAPERAGNWPAWGGECPGEPVDQLPWPADPRIRRWIAEHLAARLAQAVGRARGARWGGAPLEIEIHGGIWPPEIEQALAGHGIVIDEVRAAARSVGRIGRDWDALEEMIRAAALGRHARGERVAAVLVADEVRRLGHRVGNDRVAGVLGRMRMAGELPAAQVGRPRRRLFGVGAVPTRHGAHSISGERSRREHKCTSALCA